MKILIPDSPGRNVQEAIDSLTKKKHQVDIAFPMKQHLEKSSWLRNLVFNEMARGTSQKWKITSPFVCLQGYLQDITKILDKEKYDLVMPFTHGAVAACCYGKNDIEKFARLTFPDFDSFIKFHDKWQTFKICKEIGIPVPETWKPANDEDLKEIANLVSYPVVIKIQMGCGVQKGVRVAENQQQLFGKYHEIKSQRSFGFLDNFETPLIQEFLKGPIHDVVGLYNKGEPVAIMSQKRVVTLPIDGGTGSVNESTYEPEIINYTCELMRATKWTGPAMCEFKKTGSNDYALLEVNPKFWGTLGLATAAGLDIPNLTADLFHFGSISPVKAYNIGLMYRWSLSEEIKSLAQYQDRKLALKEYITRTFRKNKKSELKFNKPLRSLLIFLSTVRYIFSRKNRQKTLL